MPYLVGNGAHGRDIGESLLGSGWVVFLDDDPSRSWGAWPDRPVEFLVGINDPTTRHKVASRLEAQEWVAWNDGRFIHPAAQVTNDVTLGRHVHVGGHSFLVRCTIGDYTTIAPGVTICGDVTIGEEVFVGAGATICNLVTIEDRAVIGAGATVLPGTTVPAGETWVGVPARPR